MVFELKLFLFLVSLAVLSIASYTDLKKRIVPNWLTFSAVIFGLAAQLLAGYYFNDLSYFYFALIAGIMTFAFSYALYRLGVWAGGDAKLFTAIAVLQPANYGILRDLLGLSHGLLESISLPLFPLTLFFYSLLAMLPMGAVISLKAIAERKELRQKTIADLRKKTVYGIEFSLLAVGLGQLIGLAAQNSLVQYFIVFAAIAGYGLIKWKWKKIIAIAVFCAALLTDLNVALAAAFLFAGLMAFYLLIALFIKSRKEVLRKKVSVKELAEGMIPANSISELGGKIIEWKEINISSMIKLLLKGNSRELMNALMPEGRMIADKNKARGLTMEEINELRQLEKKRLIGKAIEIKLSSAFAPAVLAAFIAANLTGDILWLLLF